MTDWCRGYQMVIVLLKYGVGSNDSESKYYEELHCTCFNKRRLFSQTEYWS